MKRVKRAAMLKGFSEFFGALADLSVGFLGDMHALIKKSAMLFHSGFAFPFALLEAYEKTGDIIAAWEECVSGYSEHLTGAEKVLLNDFASAFEGASKKEFYDRSKKAEQKFSEFFSDAEEKSKKNGKLTVALSSLLAALMFIILI